MQDIHAFGGGAIFNTGGGGDRRLRPHNQSHQTLKCPRCDSLNTKFCYYNNYNLSQPRHFCKNCRRYWTKGGVLRNVPVGGGCRKGKRSKPKNSSDSSASQAQPQEEQRDDHSKANSRSSSESSSTLTAANSNVAAAASGSATSSAGGSGEGASLLKAKESSGLVDQQGSASGIFPEVGNFTSPINLSTTEATPYSFSSMLNQEQFHGTTHQSVMMMDPTVEVELSGVRSRFESLGALDWQGGYHQSLFDLPNTLDQTYWNQTQWSDQDHTGLYNLP